MERNNHLHISGGYKDFVLPKTISTFIDDFKKRVIYFIQSSNNLSSNDDGRNLEKDLIHTLRFPSSIIQEVLQREGLDLNKFSASYRSGERWLRIRNDGTVIYINRFHTTFGLFDHSLNGLHLEGPHNLTLFYDNKPLCNVSYAEFQSGYLIHQMQGLKEKKAHAVYELSYFDWKVTLVRLVERMMILHEKQHISILPSHLNSWEDIRDNKYGQGYRIYDETALKLGFILEDIYDISLSDSMRYSFFHSHSGGSVQLYKK